MMKQALVIIDIQNDYFPGGKMELAQPEEALTIVKQLEKHFAEAHLPIFYIQHLNHRKGASFFEAGTIGAELHAELAVEKDALIIEKHFPNSFYQTDLEAKLRELNVEQLVITGMMTHMCVDSTTRAAAELGFQPILIGDATATRDLEVAEKKVAAADVQTAFLAALTSFAEVKPAADYLQG